MVIKLQDLQQRVEREELTQNLLQEEASITTNLYKDYRDEKDYWNLKSCSPWLMTGVRNTYFTTKQNLDKYKIRSPKLWGYMDNQKRPKKISN